MDADLPLLIRRRLRRRRFRCLSSPLSLRHSVYHDYTIKPIISDGCPPTRHKF